MTTEKLARLLTLGCRILAEQGILDAYGHLSARSPDRADHFVISRSISSALVDSPNDFIVLNFDGDVVAGTGYPNAEWPIHAAVYRAREDVGSVLHSHSRLSRIFSLSHRKLQGLLTSNSVEWQEGVPVYRAAGLVTTRERGEAVAAALKAGSAVLLRGHGDVVVGKDVHSSVLKAIALQQNADILHELLAHGGDPEVWTADELRDWRTPRQSISAEAQAALGNRTWEYYEARVSGRLARLLGQLPTNAP